MTSTHQIPRRLLPFYTASVLVLILSGPTSASTIDLSWDACSPILAEKDASSSMTVYVSVIGQSVPHKAYQFWLTMKASGDGELPDAWRFDVDGCQGNSRITIEHAAAANCANCCPSFESLPSLQIQASYLTSILSEAEGGGPNVPHMGLANAYPSGNTVATNPTVRYQLGSIVFDHSASLVGPGSCGGFERAVTLSLIPRKCEWIPAAWDGTETRFEIGQGWLTVRPNAQSVPASEATWGQIKSHYRR